MTQDEIARLAGVSRPTVSLALNHPERLAPDTLAKVLDVLKGADYVPDQTARNFQLGRSGVVGMVFRVFSDMDFSTPFLFQTMKGLHQATAKINMGLRFIPYSETIDLSSFFRSRTIDGGIYTTYRPEFDFDAVKQFHAQGFPLIIFGKEPAFACADVDYTGGVKDAVFRLAARGRKRIVYLGGGMDRIFNQEKFLGFQQGLEAAGLDPRAQIINHECWTTEMAQATIMDTVEKKVSFDAVLAADGDFVGIGALNALRDKGISVPDQVSLIAGVGSYYAQVTTPPMAAIRHTYDKRAEAAVEMLDIWMKTGKKPESRIIPMEFLDGGTL